MAKAARKAEGKPDTAAMEAASYQFAGRMSAMPTLPVSWAYDIAPDGSKPCACCGARDWWGGNGRGWCCAVCHPPTDKQAASLRRVTGEAST